MSDRVALLNLLQPRRSVRQAFYAPAEIFSCHRTQTACRGRPAASIMLWEARPDQHMSACMILELLVSSARLCSMLETCSPSACCRRHRPELQQSHGAPGHHPSMCSSDKLRGPQANVLLVSSLSRLICGHPMSQGPSSDGARSPAPSERSAVSSAGGSDRKPSSTWDHQQRQSARSHALRTCWWAWPLSDCECSHVSRLPLPCSSYSAGLVNAERCFDARRMTSCTRPPPHPRFRTR